MKKIQPPELGHNNAPGGSWVQTERAAHEAWASLTARKPKAAQLMHHLVAQMGQQNAVVVSQKTLAKLMGCSLRTTQYAIADLSKERWIQVVKVNGPGSVAAYVVNDRVAWGQRRDQRWLSVFSATVLADVEDQTEQALETSDLRRIPLVYPGERQLPTGPGEDPPSQPSIPNLEPDLPSIQLGEDARARHELEKRGQQRLTE